jgi:hypothetical protein
MKSIKDHELALSASSEDDGALSARSRADLERGVRSHLPRRERATAASNNERSL